jgi:hypothetical protein
VRYTQGFFPGNELSPGGWEGRQSSLLLSLFSKRARHLTIICSPKKSFAQFFSYFPFRIYCPFFITLLFYNNHCVNCFQISAFKDRLCFIKDRGVLGSPFEFLIVIYEAREKRRGV